MVPEIIRYYNSEEDFKPFHNNLKQLPCPHCKSTGTLILNGYLKGYEEGSHTKKAVRGRRVFCNNRRKRSSGCGRTFCVLQANTLKHFCITADCLWCFLKNVVKSSSKIEAFRRIKYPMSNSSCYRLWKKFSKCLSIIRSTLVKFFSVPAPSKTYNSETETIAHLESAFSNYSLPISPIAAFQTHVQAAFL